MTTMTVNDTYGTAGGAGFAAAVGVAGVAEARGLAADVAADGEAFSFVLTLT
jgi:hypothetical protein